MTFNKKGMAIGQVFIYIVMVITFALIMIFGYQMVQKLIYDAEQVEFIQFKTNLEEDIETLYSNYNSVRVVDYSLPVKHEQICFVNMDYPIDLIDLEMEDLCGWDQAACDLWADAKLAQAQGKNGHDSVEQNVFLKPQALKIKTYHISISDPTGKEEQGFLCEDITKGKFTIVLEGKGDLTELSLKG